MIETPPKIWRPKVVNKYIPLQYSNDIDDGVFECPEYGNTVYRPKSAAVEVSPREDLIYFNEDEDIEELMKGLKIGANVNDATKTEIINIIKEFWDCFAKKGAKRTILGYEFSIDTGAATPVSARNRQYGPHESIIMMEHIHALLKNGWIELCKGPWGSIIVLAPKPHQEHVTDIEDFVWRMCVSYRGLNAVTKPFTFPIPRCDDAISSLNVGPGDIWIITVDARQGYHQISVRKVDREKLAFFGPDGEKYTYSVMPFGPMNAPSFYTFMMQNFRKEWDALFYIRMRALPKIGNQVVTVLKDNTVFVNQKRVDTGSKSIIDDILIWSTRLDTALLYFRCICEVFQKYRVSFRLDKCEFLKDRAEYVGHDITPSGNCPAASKFDMIQDWTLPTNSRSLMSFIGLINFYHQYSPFFEIRLRSLRSLYRQYRGNSIPLMAWSPELIELFHELKVCITSSPVLRRYDPTEPVFLKTDWSAEGMGWILMQPASDEISQKAVQTLIETGECLFDKTKSGARLQPIAFGSRACTERERHFHSFVGEAASGRWAISQNRHFLWGAHFYWICDCKSIKEILEYSGSIPMVMRWAQELLGYHFSVIHRPASMMEDVDSLTRQFGKDIGRYEGIAHILRAVDKVNRPDAYDPVVFRSMSRTTKVKSKSYCVTTPVFTENNITSELSKWSKQSANETVNQGPNLLFTSTPVYIKDGLLPFAPSSPESKPMQAMEAIKHFHIECLCVNDVVGSSLQWNNNHHQPPVSWTFHSAFTSTKAAAIFQALYPREVVRLIDMKRMDSSLAPFNNVQHIEATFLPMHDGSIFDWLSSWTQALGKTSTTGSNIKTVVLWSNNEFLQHPQVYHAVQDYLSQSLKEHWTFSIHRYSLREFGTPLSGKRVGIQISQLQHNRITNTAPFVKSNSGTIDGYGAYLMPFNTAQDTTRPIILPRNITSLAATPHINQDQVRVLATICQQNKTLQRSQAGPQMILDPDFLGTEPTSTMQNEYFGQRFGIPCESVGSFVSARPPSTSEILAMYQLRVEPTIDISHPKLSCQADIYLPHCIPLHLRAASLRMDNPDHFSFADMLVASDDAHTDVFQCLTISTKPAPHTLDWMDAYNGDPMSKLMISLSQSKTKLRLQDAQTKQVPSCFRQAIVDRHIQFVQGKLVLFKSILTNTKYVGLIIVPPSLRRPLFNHYHAGPSGGHVGEYKTLYRMRARFIWQGMREDIKAWVKSCPHCVAHNVWRSRKSELYFSWPITTPFWIMHVDLWSPGHISNNQGQKGYLLNSMCDLTQFVISTPTFNITAGHLAMIFMEQVVLSFGMCAVVVVDDGSSFKSTFEEMCRLLKITFWALSRGNHKGLSVERYHRYLNKTQTIVGNDRGTHQTFLQNCKITQYGWNSAPIDDTDIPRSMAAVGREFRFPLDVKMCPDPPLSDGTNTPLHEYVRTASNTAQFALSVLQILVEERREYHRTRHNRGKDTDAAPFQIGDIVKAHVQVNSNQDKGQPAKLSYKARGPFEIVTNLGYGAFEVRPYGKPTAATRKYKSTELYLLPPALFPAEPLDTMDQRYLNSQHAPLTHPLKHPFQIDLYNDIYFQPSLHTRSRKPTNKPFLDIDNTAFQAHTFDSSTELHSTTSTTTHQVEALSPAPIPPSATSDCQSLHTIITNSTDKLFFIQFQPEGTMTFRWYLVQVDLGSTLALADNDNPPSSYFCSFLAKHPQDQHKSDEFSRWWPDWYEYSTCPTTGQIIYGDRILFPPSRIPDKDKYVSWATTINLDPAGPHYMRGPFDFEAITHTNRMRCKVSRDNWIQCRECCQSHNITPPTIGTVTPFIRPKRNKQSQQKTREKKRKNR